QTMGMQMREGRSFTSQDGPGAQQVVIINETLARQFFPNEDPIGHRLAVANRSSAMGGGSATIVGISVDTRNRGIASSVNPEIYVPWMQNPGFWAHLVVRAAHDQNNSTGLSALATAIRNQVRPIDPNELVNQVVPMNERLSNSVANRRFQM